MRFIWFIIGTISVSVHAMSTLNLGLPESSVPFKPMQHVDYETISLDRVTGTITSFNELVDACQLMYPESGQTIDVTDLEGLVMQPAVIQEAIQHHYGQAGTFFLGGSLLSADTEFIKKMQAEHNEELLSFCARQVNQKIDSTSVQKHTKKKQHIKKSNQSKTNVFEELLTQYLLKERQDRADAEKSAKTKFKISLFVAVVQGLALIAATVSIAMDLTTPSHC